MYWAAVLSLVMVPGCDRTGPERVQQPPEALVRAEAARMSLRKAYIAWSAESHYVPPFARENLDNPDVVVFRTWDMETFHVFQAAGEDRLNRNLGDNAGVRIYKLDGTPADGWGVWGDRPLESLADEGCYWESWGTASRETLRATPRVFPDSAPVAKLDLRMLGVFPVMPGGRQRPRLLFSSEEPIEFSEREEGALRVVRVRQGDSEQVYWIDPSKDYAVTRAQSWWGGKLRFEARSTLKRMSGIWFPEVVEFYRWDHEDGAAPALVVRVHEARFNTPDLPDDLTPMDIGIQPGATVRVCNSSLPEVATATWDGRVLRTSGVASADGAAELPPIVSVQTEPAGEAWAASESAEAVKTAARVVILSDWERYTLDFIDRHRLDRRQAQQAWLMLRQCQVQAQNILLAKAGTLEQLERLERQVKESRRDKRRQLEARRQTLVRSVRRPIDTIFEQRLKPGLHQLLDPDERRRAERGDGAGAQP